jgi:hypothetical protein
LVPSQQVVGDFILNIQSDYVVKTDSVFLINITKAITTTKK